MQDIGLAGVTYAHPTTPSDDRIAISLSQPQVDRAYERLEKAGLRAFILQTCLRIEVFCAGDDADLDEVLTHIYGGQPLPASGIRRRDVEAVCHLYRVAAGLDSPLMGEAEVLGQFRSAVDEARARLALNGHFGRVLDGAVCAGRVARTMMSGTPRGSLALVAVEHARRVDSLAVIGAGAMASAVVSNLRLFPTPPHITVYARRPDDVRLPADAVAHISEVPVALTEQPLIISATSAKAELFERSVVAAALQRRDAPLTLVDLAMPPDFGPQTGDGNLEYLNVDDLARSIRRSDVADEVEAAVRILAEQQWSRLINHDRVVPVISGIMHHADEAIASTVRQFAARIEASEDKEALVRQIAHTAVRRALHAPVAFLSSSQHGASAAGTLAEAFGVSDAR